MERAAERALTALDPEIKLLDELDIIDKKAKTAGGLHQEYKGGSKYGPLFASFSRHDRAEACHSPSDIWTSLTICS